MTTDDPSGKPANSKTPSEAEKKKHIEDELDEALAETFPASDPVELPTPDEQK